MVKAWNASPPRAPVTLPLDHAFGFELADVGPAAIKVQRQCRRADGRGLGGSRSRDRLSGGRAINGDGLSHRACSCYAAIGYSDCSVSREGVSTNASLRRHSGPCPNLQIGRLNSRGYWPKGQLDRQPNPRAQSLMTMAFPQIAVVDDDPAVLKALSRLLRSRSFHVHTYGSGQDFLASLANGLPECLIVDFQMPEMNGLELQQHLLSNGIKI